MFQIDLDGHTIPYHIHRSQRASRLTLKFGPQDGLQVVVPSQLSLAPEEIEKLLHSKKHWILRYWLRYPQLALPPKQHFTDGDLLLYLGRRYPLALTYKSNGKRLVVQGITPQQQLGVGLPERFRLEQDADAITQALEAWYWEQASTYILPRATQLATSHGFRFGKATIRDQKTRWGSCSSQGNLNFNWRLMMAPPEVIDYIILHELCHLKQMNHSRQFWQLVESHCPGYQTQETWLTRHQGDMRIR